MGNALRSTPKGLETPAYTCVRTLGDSKIEIRKYAPFTVARREMRDGISSLEGGGAGFNDLATYLFGGNELQQAMSMTTPVLIDVVADSSSMAFVLPSTCAESPPAPSGAEVSIAQVPERLVAALPFPGIVTEEEVARRRAEMAAALLANGSEYRQACHGEGETSWWWYLPRSAMMGWTKRRRRSPHGTIRACGFDSCRGRRTRRSAA